MKPVYLITICLIALTGMAIASEDMSSAELVQLAVSQMGNTNQQADVVSFDNADTFQIGYSDNGKVTQNIYYNNIGNGSAIQWGESGDMGTRQDRDFMMGSVGDEGLTYQWTNGNINQTINIRNSENIYLKQSIGGLRNVLFPNSVSSQTGQTVDQNSGSWTFCGTPENGMGGLPLCAKKIATRINNGKATAHDIYMLNYLEADYSVFPPDNITPHVVITKLNMTRSEGNLIIKFKLHNFGKQMYNASLIAEMTPKINITNLDGDAQTVQLKGDNTVEFKAEDDKNLDIKIPQKQTAEIGKYAVHSMRGLESEVQVPLNTNLKNLVIKIESD
jgi:hypothetical protein